MRIPGPKSILGAGGLTLGIGGALRSREKKKAEQRVDEFKSDEVKDWDRFTDHAARKSFVQQLGSDPATDPKLLQYADNMNRLKTGSKITSLPGDAGKSYQITKLRGSERLGCTCNDWRYKRSVAQPGEEQDCKHIKQYRQMSKTAASTYEEEGSFTHDGKRYSLQKAFRSARTQPTKQIPVDDLKWVLAYDRPDPARLAAADLTAPVLVAPDQQGRPTVVDGLHRLSKAVREGRKTIPAKILPLEALKTAGHTFSDNGRTYDVEHLWKIDRPSQAVNPEKLLGKIGKVWGDRPNRYGWEDVLANPSKYPEEMARMKNADLRYPIIVRDRDGVVIDGIHRLLKARETGQPVTAIRVTSKDMQSALVKQAGHVEDRVAERAPGAESEVTTLRAKLRQMKLRKGQTYHVPLSRGKGYAVIGDVGDHHAVKTVLGPNMRPPGERLKLARAPRDYEKEYTQYHSKPEQVENRSLRNQARRKLGLKKGDPREVDHKTPLAKGGGNGHSNLRAVSRTTNRTKFTGDT